MDAIRDTTIARDLMGRLIVPEAKFARYRLREYEDGRILLEPPDPSEKAEAEERAGMRAALGSAPPRCPLRARKGQQLPVRSERKGGRPKAAS